MRDWVRPSGVRSPQVQRRCCRGRSGVDRCRGCGNPSSLLGMGQGPSSELPFQGRGLDLTRRSFKENFRTRDTDPCCVLFILGGGLSKVCYGWYSCRGCGDSTVNNSPGTDVPCYVFISQSNRESRRIVGPSMSDNNRSTCLFLWFRVSSISQTGSGTV